MLPVLCQRANTGFDGLLSRPKTIALLWLMPGEIEKPRLAQKLALPNADEVS
jgi:hypothetical protein